jgi:Skp family chaperone for outer membrane proteins
MNKFVRIIMTGFLLVLLSACANNQAPLVAEPKPQVLVLDLSQIAKATGRDKIIAEKMEQANARLERQLSDFKEKIKDKLLKEKSRITSRNDKQALQNLQEFMLKAQKKMQLAQTQAKQKSQQYRMKLIQDFKDEVKPLAQQIARNRDASIVRIIDASSLWHSESVDITDAVITILSAAAEPVEQGIDNP